MDSATNRFERPLGNDRILREAGFVLLALAVREVETQLMGRSSAGYGIPVEGGKHLSELQAVTRSVKNQPARK
jgi:hypothetical protein